MSVHLSLWVLNKKEKNFLIFPVDRGRDLRYEIDELPNQAVPKDINEYKGYEYEDKSNNVVQRGIGHYSEKPKKDITISLKENKLLSIKLSKISPEQFMCDAYGKILKSIKAVYLKVLILENQLSFEDHCHYYLKDIFLKLPDDSEVLLYWS